MTTTEEAPDLAAIQARADAATAGPWTHYYPGQDCSGPCVDPVIHDIESDTAHADLAFIAHARTDVPALLICIRTLVEERDHQARTIREGDADLRAAESKLALAEKTIQRVRAHRMKLGSSLLGQPDEYELALAEYEAHSDGSVEDFERMQKALAEAQAKLARTETYLSKAGHTMICEVKRLGLRGNQDWVCTCWKADYDAENGVL